MAVTFESSVTIRCDKCGDTYSCDPCDGEIDDPWDCDCSSAVSSLIDDADEMGWLVNLKGGECLCSNCKAGVLTARERDKSR